MEESGIRTQFAVLIDADNISSKYAGTIFEEIEQYGFSTYRRIYGDWSKNNGWKEETLLAYSIAPVQQFSYTPGKNATDIAMVIDAMDILHNDSVQGFCLVTSDSDFTPLAMRLREGNKYVVGMGESKTPNALTEACNKFIYLDLVVKQNENMETAPKSQAAGKPEEGVTKFRTVRRAVLSLLTEDEKIDLGYLGQRLGERFTDFDVRNYGYSKLSVMIEEEFPELELVKEDNRRYVRKKAAVPRENLEKEILNILLKKNGEIDNLSTLNEELLKKYKDLDYNDYGYSRISTFLRSMSDKVKVEQNRVTLKNKTAKKKK